MVETKVVLMNKMGLHARPASMFIKTASKYESSVTVKGNGKEADAKSILMVMSLGLTKGTEISISAEGPDEEDCIDALKELVDNNFGENE